MYVLIEFTAYFYYLFYYASIDDLPTVSTAYGTLLLFLLTRLYNIIYIFICTRLFEYKSHFLLVLALE